MAKYYILGINGSPRRRGNTYKLVEMFLNSYSLKGAEKEIISIVDYNIKYCTGCGKCFVEGNCPLKDEVSSIHQKLFQADGIVFGAPSYECHVPAQTKTFFDRSAFIIHRPQLIGKSAVALAVEAAIGADITSEYILGCLIGMGSSPIGTLTATAYGPHIFPDKESVKKDIEILSQKLMNEVIDEKNTHKRAESFKPPEELRKVMKSVGRYLKADYEFWKQRGWLEGIGIEKKKEKVTPKFETVKSLAQNMPYAFNPENAKGIDAVVQFVVPDEDFKGCLSIKDCKCEYLEEESENPTVTIIAPSKILLGIVRGEINPVTAMMTRKYTVKGSWKILTKFYKLFG